MRYYYVIFGSSSEFMRASYADISKCDSAQYLYKNLATDGILSNFFYRVHNNQLINSFIYLPGKSVWFKKLTPSIYSDKSICFLFFAGGTRFNAIRDGYIEFLREHFPYSKMVCFYQDLVSIKRPVGIETIKDKFDLVLSFDQNDCRDFDLIYYPLVYSSSSFTRTSITNDVYFVGKAKDRLPEILNTYRYLKESGLKCDFNIIGVDLKDQKYADEIHYCEPLKYSENIKHILSSKAMLEIMQQNGAGYTLRTCEAIANDRMLITNNSEVGSAPFYDPSRIITFDDPEDIDVELIRKTIVPVNYGYKENLSPIRLLEFIDQKL